MKTVKKLAAAATLIAFGFICNCSEPRKDTQLSQKPAPVPTHVG